MIVHCPHCGGTVVVNGFDRRPLNIVVTKVYDALQLHGSVAAAAENLGCSRAYVYKVLKAARLTPADVIKGQRQNFPKRTEALRSADTFGRTIQKGIDRWCLL